jgi:hypothetical protein
VKNFQTSGFDERHEDHLVDKLTAAIVKASLVENDGAKILVLRTGEIASALLTCLASMLALSPPDARNRAALRQLEEQFGKRLRKRVDAAVASPDFFAFKARTFRDDDSERGGHA